MDKNPLWGASSAIKSVVYCSLPQWPGISLASTMSFGITKKITKVLASSAMMEHRRTHWVTHSEKIRLLSLRYSLMRIERHHSEGLYCSHQCCCQRHSILIRRATHIPGRWWVMSMPRRLPWTRQKWCVDAPRTSVGWWICVCWVSHGSQTSLNGRSNIKKSVWLVMRSFYSDTCISIWCAIL